MCNDISNRTLQVVASSTVGVSRIVCSLHADRSPQPLRIRDPGKRPVLGKSVMPVDRAIQEPQLLSQLGMTMRRQCLHEIFKHGTHPPRDLDAPCAAMANFGACEVHKVLPVRRQENEPQFAGFVTDFLAAHMPQADVPKQAVKLVDGEHSRRRIVDGR